MYMIIYSVLKWSLYWPGHAKTYSYKQKDSHIVEKASLFVFCLTDLNKHSISCFIIYKILDLVIPFFLIFCDVFSFPNNPFLDNIHRT